MIMNDWNVIMFLSSPSLKTLDDLKYAGLVINDLPMHDFSRDILFAKTSHLNELKNLIDQEVKKNKDIEISLIKLELERKENERVLEKIIPKNVIEKIHAGTNPKGNFCMC